MLRTLSNYMRSVAGPSTLGYDAGKRDRSSSWDPQALSPVAETIESLPRIRAKSRDLIQNTDIAASGVVKLTNGVVGWGIRPQAQTDSEAFNELVDRRHEAWSKVCSPTGLDVYGVQCQATFGMFSSGESFVVRTKPPKDADVPIPLWVNIYEADMVDDQLNKDVGQNKIRQGIEFDRWGRAVKYYFHRTHPGDVFHQTIGDHIVIPHQDVVHYCEKAMHRPSQVRGVPRLAPVIATIRNLGDFQLSELVKQKVAACFGLIFTGVEAEASTSGGALCDSSGRPITKAYPGMIGYSPTGSAVQVVNPPSVEGYWDYIRGHQHGVSAGIGVPYARLTGDLTKVNFASSRIGEGYYIRENDAVQWLTAIPLLCDVLWHWFISASYQVGSITAPRVPVMWATQQFPSANPQQDAAAIQMAIRDGRTTLSRVIAEDGENPRKVFRERQAENAILDKYGLVFDSDPRHRTLAGVTQPVYDPGNDEPNDTAN